MVALSAALCQRVGTAPGDGSQHELGDLALPHVPIFRVQALDALDSIAFSAMRFCVFNATVDAEADGENSLLKALVADGSDAGGLEAQINLPAGKEVRDAKARCDLRQGYAVRKELLILNAHTCIQMMRPALSSFRDELADSHGHATGSCRASVGLAVDGRLMQVEKTIGEQLGQHHIVRVLAGLLEETDAKLFMAGIVILGKVSSQTQNGTW